MEQYKFSTRCIIIKQILMMTEEANINYVQEPITSAEPEIRKIIEEVLQLEKEKIYMKIPKNINEEIITVIKRVIK